MKNRMNILALGLALAVGAAGAARGGVERERLSEGWEFMRADGSASETNSAAWRAVRVPHDWGVEKPFDPKKPYGDAYLEPTGIGWYRRTFRLDPARAARVKAGGHVFFESNGMMSHSKIWVNGAYVGGWPYGYTAFRCDLTPHLRLDGENTLVVRCHNHTDSSRWYTGGGMYRECRLAYCPADYLIPGSVAITTPDVTKEKATVHVAWEMSKSGRKERTFTVALPRLWDIDDPYLYSLEIAGETFRYGIRTIAFHPDARGFQLNGRRVELKGVCLHHELGVLGAAYNRAAMKRRFLKLKEAGVNAIRCSHNPEDPDFLDLCDELGLLVKDEVFDEWRRIGVAGKRKDGYTKLFDEWHERDVRAWVRAGRNHPSVIMWSIGNEIPEGYAHIAPTREFIATAKALDAIVKSEDRTRPVTNANNNRANATNEYGKTLDIYGFNYSCYMFGPFKRKNPDKPFFGSETQCALSSRGVYTFPVKWGWTQEKTGSLHVSGYGVEACGWSGNPRRGWACAPDAQWFNMDAHPECMGEFVWTGWDYLGGPYWADKMVKKFKIKGIHSCATGFFDLAGFPKDTFWLFQSRWRPDLPMAHIVPHWNWPDRVGKVTPVHVFTSGDEGELFLNGRSLGRRKKDPKNWKKAYRLVWDDVVYEPGTLRVVTYRNGAPWAEKTVSTTGPAAKLKLEVEDLAEADADLAFVNLEVQDAQGRFVPDAAVEVAFSVKGPGELVATDNGDEADFDSFHSPVRRTFSGRLQAIVRKAPDAAGKIEVEATAPSLACPSATCTVFAPAVRGTENASFIDRIAPADAFAPGGMVLFIGDSITHGGRKSDMNHGYGHGYAAEITARYLGYRPEMDLCFLNRGISGDATPDLLKRWRRDAIEPVATERGWAGPFPRRTGRLKPDVISLLVGVNDYMSAKAGKHTTPEQYAANLESIVEQTLKELPDCMIVLCEPFRLPVDMSEDFTKRQKAVRDIAGRHGLCFVDFQRLFSEVLIRENPNSKYWIWDACHPTYAAHIRMADWWLQAVVRHGSRKSGAGGGDATGE